MPTLTVSFDSSSEVERLALEQAVASLTHLRPVAADAPSGTVRDAGERVVLADGRAALRVTLEAALPARLRSCDAAPNQSPARGPKASAPAGG